MLRAIAPTLIAFSIAALFFVLDKKIERMPNKAAVAGYVVSGLLLIGGITIWLWPKAKKSRGATMVPEKDKPDVQVTSIGQRGGITAGVINIQAETKPKVGLSGMAYRVVTNGHLYEAILTIEAPYAVPRIRITAHANSIQSLDITPHRSLAGLFFMGHSGKREGYHFATIQNAAPGTYRIRVTTARPEQIRIDLE